MSEKSNPPDPGADGATPSVHADSRFRFGLIHVMYAVSLFAAAVAAFGVIGLLIGACVVGGWAFVLCGPSRIDAIIRFLSIAPFLVIVPGLVLPSVGGPREAGPRTLCVNNMKQIALALHNYQDTFGTLPPAYVADEFGKPMHSWRVLILPYMEHQGLYDAYDFSEPWDGPNNRFLLDAMPDVYRCGTLHQKDVTRSTTSFVAVVGNGTAWPGPDGMALSNIPDKLSDTVLLVEYNKPSIPWTQPSDLTYDQAIEILNSGDPDVACGHCTSDYSGLRYTTDRMVSLANGSHFIAETAQFDYVWPAALGIDDGIPFDHDQFRSDLDTSPQEEADWGFLISFLILCVLCVLPTPWVFLWRERR